MWFCVASGTRIMTTSVHSQGYKYKNLHTAAMTLRRVNEDISSSIGENTARTTKEQGQGATRPHQTKLIQCTYIIWILCKPILYILPFLGITRITAERSTQLGTTWRNQTKQFKRHIWVVLSQEAKTHDQFLTSDLLWELLLLAFTTSINLRSINFHTQPRYFGTPICNCKVLERWRRPNLSFG